MSERDSQFDEETVLLSKSTYVGLVALDLWRLMGDTMRHILLLIILFLGKPLYLDQASLGPRANWTRSGPPHGPC